MTKETGKTNIGAFFRDYRENLGLSLRETAGESMSAAGLTRFEHGESEISTESAVNLMFNLGMNRTELRRIQAQNPYAFPLNIIDLIMTNDISAITRVEKQFLEAHADDLITYLGEVERLIFQCAELDVYDTFQLNSVDEKQLHKFLTYPQGWNVIEAEAMFATLPFASPELRGFCRAGLKVSTDISTDFAVQLPVLLGITLADVKYGDYDNLTEDYKALNECANQEWQSIYVRKYRPLIQTLRLLTALDNSNDSALNAEFNHYLASLERVGAEAMIHILKQYWQLNLQPIKSGKTGRVFPIETRQKELPTDIGMRLGIIRRQRGLSLNQVCLDWSISTQSRFENGSSQLSYNRTRRLTNFLLTEWSEFGIHKFSYTRQAYNAITKLKVEGNNLSPATAAPVIEHLIAEMHDVPATVRAIQVLPVRIYSYAFNYTHVPEQLIEQAGKILMGTKKWNHAYYALFTCASGNMDYQQSYQIWRRMIGADHDYHSDIEYRDLVDYYIALKVLESGDKVVATAMIADMKRAFKPKIISVQTMFTKVATLLCQDVITPGREIENQIEQFMRTMVELGYRDDVQDQVRNLQNYLKRPEFMVDLVTKN